jgi:hypothetical protein
VTGAASLSLGPKPVTTDLADLSLQFFGDASQQAEWRERPRHGVHQGERPGIPATSHTCRGPCNIRASAGDPGHSRRPAARIPGAGLPTDISARWANGKVFKPPNSLLSRSQLCGVCRQPGDHASCRPAGRAGRSAPRQDARINRRERAIGRRTYKPDHAAAVASRALGITGTNEEARYRPSTA